MALKHLIQNKLIDLVQKSECFYTVTYDNDNKAAISTLPKKGSEVVASAHTNEVSSLFGADSRSGRDRKLAEPSGLSADGLVQDRSFGRRL